MHRARSNGMKDHVVYQINRDRRRRTTRAAVLGSVVVATAALLPAPPVAIADPVRSADQILTRYRELSKDAERTAESMNSAQVEYNKQRKTVARERRVSAAATKKLDSMQKEMDAAQVKVDALARASYRGARVNRLYAMLVSDSPQSLLDNMSGLEIMSRQAATDLRVATDVAKRTRQARSDADAAAATARAAVAEAERHRGDLQAKQADLQLEAVQIRAIYKSLTGKQLAALRGPRYEFDARAVPKGTSPELIAVQAAISRIGDPYVWGAVGPHQFDCSGLMLWAYKQAKRTIPRTSEAQLAGGTPVARKDLKPGDLIIYYSSASHVGMYVGDGFVVHASTFGVPVAVVPIDKAGPYNAARRY
ncbi:NlpC/P60 family protein [Gordonia malaquae NBRC 108250]|uniref:NlpC/P60 family protein n=2 Tax=Gordonia malaquae TaxID=410332 RepID=M3UTI6_GORML|nr:NlpC/P60 family protein [Gordonia malaquae NBRC 108250]